MTHVHLFICKEPPIRQHRNSRMEKVDTIKAFIRRLVDLQGNLGTKLHELESRHIRMCSSLNNADDEASEAAEV